jgi:hypothetical protein
VRVNQRKRLTRWSQKAQDTTPASETNDRFALSRNPMESTALRMRPMTTGNGVTPTNSLGGRSPSRAGAYRMLVGRRMPEEAKPEVMLWIC